MEKPFQAYQGDQPYVFVSYAHEESPIVYEELVALNERFNVWYDEGIAPGSSWRDELAEALAECSLFLIFMSGAAIRSPNCLKEINFALARNRPFLVVYLEPTDLPAGVEFSLSDVQAIEKYSFGEDDYRRKLDDAVENLLPEQTARIGDVRLDEVIEHNAVFTRFGGRQDFLDRHVELALLAYGETHALPSLVEEARLFAGIGDPCLQGILGHGSWEGRTYFLLERGSGFTVDSAMTRPEMRSAPLAFLLNTVYQVGKVLDRLHDAGVLIERFDPRLFGYRTNGELFMSFPALFAARSDDTGDRYASPEELAGKDKTLGSCFYSLGIMFYEMLVGRLPYSARTPSSERAEEVLASVRDLRTRLADGEVNTAYPAFKELTFGASLRTELMELLEDVLDPSTTRLLKKDMRIKRYLDEYYFLPRVWRVLKDLTEHGDCSRFMERVIEADADWQSRIIQFQSDWRLYQRGDLEESVFNSIKATFVEWLQVPANREAWDQHGDEYPKELLEYINHIDTR